MIAQYGPIPWTTIAWSMAASACFTFGTMHLVLWARRRAEFAHLAYATAAMGATATAFFELAIMRAETSEQMAWAIRWAHVPVTVQIVSLIIFVHLYFRTSNLWLALATIGLRCAALIVDLTQPVNLNYSLITGIRRIQVWGGETVSVAQGIHNPLTIIGESSSLLFMAFVVQTGYRAYGEGMKRPATLVCGSIVFFLAIAGGHAALLHRGVIASPYLITYAWLAIVIILGCELNTNLLRSIELATKLQTSEAERIDGEQSLKLAFSTSAMGLWIWDVVRDVVWTSDSTLLLYEFKAGESVDLQRFLQVLHPDDRQHVRRSIDSALVNCGDFEAEYRVVLANGVVRWVGSRGRVECNDDGRPTRIRGVSLDLTLRKAAETEMQRQQSELAHLSRVSILGMLSGSLAHELNQPLAAILSNTQAAQRFLDSDPSNVGELRAILADIVQDDQRAGEVIQRLRVLHKKGAVQQDQIDVSELISDVVKLMRNDLINNRITVAVHTTDALPQIAGDRVQIQQVLLNLIMNARDAMMPLVPARRQLDIRSSVIANEGVCVTVADRGVGIPHDQLEQIFQQYMTTKAQGIGLGLAICKTIITAHSGRVWATNNADSGASVHFVLPFANGVPQ